MPEASLIDPCDYMATPELEIVDIFDPRLWAPLPTYRRLYLDAHCETYAIVDEEDYQWAVQSLWSITPNSTKKKYYATRMTRQRGENRQTKLYLHKEIMWRVGPPPTYKHTMVDHLDGDSLNCRRSNLRWATPSENRANYYGIAALQRVLGV